jgi:hypothetical protein
MTVAFKKLIARISKLASHEQDAIASLLEKELSWNKKFSKSQKQLTSLADEALAEFKKGKTQSLKI